MRGTPAWRSPWMQGPWILTRNRRSCRARSGRSVPRLDRRGLGRVIETGARYLLNPRKKHDPTLMDPDPSRRELRVDFLRRSIDLACALGAEAVSFWSGSSPLAVDEDEGLARLAEALQPVIATRRAGRHAPGLRAGAGHVPRYPRTVRSPR